MIVLIILLIVYVVIGLFVGLFAALLCNPYGHLSSLEVVQQACFCGVLWGPLLLRVLYYVAKDWYITRYRDY